LKLSKFDQNRITDDSNNIIETPYSQAVRLSNELRSKPARTYIDSATGQRIDVPAKIGFDIETCTILQIKNWINDRTIKKSEALLMFVHRVLAMRFETEYSQMKDKIDSRFLQEYDLIQSEKRNEIEWLGDVGYSNLTRLDRSINNSKNKIVRQKNGSIKVVRI